MSTAFFLEYHLEDDQIAKIQIAVHNWVTQQQHIYRNEIIRDYPKLASDSEYDAAVQIAKRMTKAHSKLRWEATGGNENIATHVQQVVSWIERNVLQNWAFIDQSSQIESLAPISVLLSEFSKEFIPVLLELLAEVVGLKATLTISNAFGHSDIPMLTSFEFISEKWRERAQQSMKPEYYKSCFEQLEQIRQNLSNKRKSYKIQQEQLPVMIQKLTEREENIVKLQQICKQFS